MAIFLRLRFRDDETSETMQIFYRQQKFDPASMDMPVTGLREGSFFIEGNGYLPPEINHLFADAVGGEDDSSGLAAALSPRLKPIPDKTALRLVWIVTAFVILLGLTFLLLWMLTFI